MLCNQRGGCQAQGQGNGTVRPPRLSSLWAGVPGWSHPAPPATLFLKQKAPVAKDQWGRRANASPKRASSQAGAELI